jgi:hypothetical protein
MIQMPLWKSGRVCTAASAAAAGAGPQRGRAVIGWEQEGHALEALGELANTGQRTWCRVRACGEIATHGDHCEEHDTPEVSAMVRPHVYVFDGRHIVLESSPWDETTSGTMPQGAAPAPPASPPATGHAGAPPLTQAESLARAAAPARPCWAWCGSPGPAPRCHPASRYGRAPTFPCLTCGREIHACEGDVLHCLQCAPFARDLEVLGPARAVAAWFDEAQLENWEERAAILQDSGFRRELAELRAAVLVWRARPGPSPAAPAPAPEPACGDAAVASDTHQLEMFQAPR